MSQWEKFQKALSDRDAWELEFCGDSLTLTGPVVNVVLIITRPPVENRISIILEPEKALLRDGRTGTLVAAGDSLLTHNLVSNPPIFTSEGLIHLDTSPGTVILSPVVLIRS